MNHYEAAHARVQAWINNAPVLPDALTSHLNEADHTVVFAGQIGGYVHVQAWLQDEGVIENMVKVSVAVSREHTDPGEEQPDLAWDEFFMPLDQFSKAVADAMLAITVW